MNKLRLMSPGPHGQVINEYGLPERPPAGWAFLPAGDAAVTRKVTAMGPAWRVQIKKKRRMQSLGLWAPAGSIAAAQKEVSEMRADPSYAGKKVHAAKSRARKQEMYARQFEEAVIGYLSFHSKYQAQEVLMARLVTEHAIPVGSGTVARTSRIPIEERAARAVIAWMRHQTTHYDRMKIARIKGERRNVRRQLAQESVNLLKEYRKGDPIRPECPLWQVLSAV